MATYRNNATTPIGSTVTDASYRAWITQFKTALTSAGWTQSADTGQLNEATVTYPVAVSTFSGYHIYYLNDTLHASFPLYMKIQWGSGNALTRTQWKIQFGYATNGAGTFTGWTSPEFAMSFGGSTSVDTGSGTTGVCLASGGNGWGFFSFQYAASTTFANRPFFLVQRRFNTDGSLASSGDWCLLYQMTAVTGQSYMFSVERGTGNTWGGSNNFAFCMPVQQGQNNSTGGDTEVYRHYARMGPVRVAGAGCTYFLSEISTDATFALNVYGNTRTWLATGHGGMSYQNSNNNHCLAVLWE